MRDWASIAKACGLEIPAADLPRVVQPLNSLEETFRPLVQNLAPGLEPATGFTAEADAE